MSENLNTAELFRGNPYLEWFGGRIDDALRAGTVDPKHEGVLKLAELYELRTANMIAYEAETTRSTTGAFKDELRDRVGSEKPKRKPPQMG